MSLTVELIIIIIAGALSVAFLVWYFYSSSKKTAKCQGCQLIQMEEIKNYLKQKKLKEKKAKDSSSGKGDNFN